MASTSSNKATDATSAAPFYTMNLVNSILFSVLSGVYTVVSVIACFLLGAPQVNEMIVPCSSKKTVKDGRRRRRVAVITGSNTGIGFETAYQLVVKHDVDVVLACRSRDKAIRAAETINAAAAAAAAAAADESARVHHARAHFLHPCDLSSFESVRQFAKKVQENYSTIDILINNAGVNNTQEGRTIDDLELIFQSNLLGHFLLTKLLFDLFPNKSSEEDEEEEGRIVTLSSVAHHFVNSSATLDEQYWKESAKLDTSTTSPLPSYLRSVVQDCMESYPPSKLATLLFAMEINRRFGSSASASADSNTCSKNNNKKKVRAISVNPGAVASDIWRSFPDFTQILLKRIFLSTDQGCSTSVVAAVGELPPDAFYLQPYWLPGNTTTTTTNEMGAPFPVLEMMGPYVGYRVTKPRLPPDGGVVAAGCLWRACEDITGCKFE